MSDSIQDTLKAMLAGLDELAIKQGEELTGLSQFIQRIENAKTRVRIMGQSTAVVIPQERLLQGFVSAAIQRQALCESLATLGKIIGSIIIQIEPVQPPTVPVKSLFETLEGKTVTIPEGAKLRLVNPKTPVDIDNCNNACDTCALLGSRYLKCEYFRELYPTASGSSPDIPLSEALGGVPLIEAALSIPQEPDNTTELAADSEPGGCPGTLAVFECDRVPKDEVATTKAFLDSQEGYTPKAEPCSEEECTGSCPEDCQSENGSVEIGSDND